MSEKLVHQYDDFLEFVRVYYDAYISECSHGGHKAMSHDKYMNKYFFWLVDQYKENKRLAH